MAESSDLQMLEEDTWTLKKKFLTVIEPYRSDLWRYCLVLTRSPWDAEDLVQETLMKAFASLGQIWQPLMPKSYLFRIATNTWLNQCRRSNKFVMSQYEDTAHYDVSSSCTFEVSEAIETLLTQLPPRQATVVLLIDVFDFTAKETAEMLSATEGAVKAALHRARTTLKSLSAIAEQSKEIAANVQSKGSRETKFRPAHPRVIDAYIEAFHRRDPDAMAALFAEHAHNDIVHVGQEYGRDVIRNNSIRDTFGLWSGRLDAVYKLLWGIPVIVVLMETNDGFKLKSIIYVETLDNEIVYKREYYFCDDLLTEAANVLGVSVDKR